MATKPDEWRGALSDLIESIRQLRQYEFTFDDIDAAQSFVCNIGNILVPIAIYAKESSAKYDFGNIIESSLIPALVEARINYEGGHLSLSDMLEEEDLCQGVAERLRHQVEKWFDDDIVFKSGSYINLSTRYAKAGDMNAAQRTLVKGVRSAFTYGYRKDTTINCFVVAFESMAPYLGVRFKEVADFIAQTIIVLSQLTDGRMLYYVSSYFIGIICKHDLEYAAYLAQELWKHCRNLKPHWILLAAEDQGVDLQELKLVFSEHAPDVELEFQCDDDDDDSDYDPRPDFSTGDTVFADTEAELVAQIEDAIETSSYGSGLYRLASLINSLLVRNEIDSALDVFSEFELGLRELLGSYPLPSLPSILEHSDRAD